MSVAPLPEWCDRLCSEAIHYVAWLDQGQMDTPAIDLRPHQATILIREGLIAHNPAAGPHGVFILTHAGRAFVKHHAEMLPSINSLAKETG